MSECWPVSVIEEGPHIWCQSSDVVNDRSMRHYRNLSCHSNHTSNQWYDRLDLSHAVVCYGWTNLKSPKQKGLFTKWPNAYGKAFIPCIATSKESEHPQAQL